MRRATSSLLLGVAIAGLAACSAAGSIQPTAGAPTALATAAAPTATSSAAARSLADAAAVITDACSVFPLALGTALVPHSTGPQAQGSPPSCEITDGTSSVVVTIDATATTAAPTGAQPVPGVVGSAFVDHPAPGDTRVTVLLTPDKGRLTVEVTTADGVDHTTEAVGIAQAVIAKLGG